jgi:hypothetical protein
MIWWSGDMVTHVAGNAAKFKCRDVQIIKKTDNVWMYRLDRIKSGQGLLNLNCTSCVLEISRVSWPATVSFSMRLHNAVSLFASITLLSNGYLWYSGWSAKLTNHLLLMLIFWPARQPYSFVVLRSLTALTDHWTNSRAAVQWKLCRNFLLLHVEMWVTQT